MALFMTFKPKAAKNVKAERLTHKTVEEIVATFFGMARVEKYTEGSGEETVETFKLKIGTLDGVLEAFEGNWIVRTEDGVEVWGDPEFNEKYERARVTTNA